MHWANIITTAGAIGAAGATVWLATATKKLATSTSLLVQTTKFQGEHIDAANQRSYSLTSRQIDLQSKSNVYLDTLRYFYDDFLMIQEMAASLGLAFDPKASGNKLPFDQKVTFGNDVINEISLHGSLSIGYQLAEWMARVKSLRDLLTPYMSYVVVIDVYDAEPRIPSSELPAVTQAFTEQFDSLKVRYAEIMVNMREELHPTD